MSDCSRHHNLGDLEDLSMEKLSKEWNIDSILSRLGATRSTGRDELKENMTDAIEKTRTHEMTMKAKGRVPRFTRTKTVQKKLVVIP